MSLYEELAAIEQLFLRAEVREGVRRAEALAEGALAEGDRELAARAQRVRGECFYEDAKYERSREALERAYRLLRDLPEANPVGLGRVRSCLADLYWSQGRAALARRRAEQALAAVPDEPAPEELLDAAHILRNLTTLERYTKDHHDSLELLQRARGLVEAMPSPDPLELASLYSSLAMQEHHHQNHDAARELIERSLELRREVLGERHIYIAYNLHQLASLEIVKGSRERARQIMDEALPMLEEGHGSGRQNISTFLVTCATLDLFDDDLDRAAETITRAVDAGEAFFGEDHPNIAMTRYYAGTYLSLAERPAEAEAHLLKAVASLLDYHETRLNVLTRCLNALLVCLRTQEKYGDMIRLVDELTQRWESSPTVAPQLLATIWNGSSEAAYRLGKRKRALKYLRKAVYAAEQGLGSDSRELIPLLNNMNQLLVSLRRHSEATRVRRRLEELKGLGN